jgi:hypothetical protein
MPVVSRLVGSTQSQVFTACSGAQDSLGGFEREFSGLYAAVGRPAKTVRYRRRKLAAEENIPLRRSYWRELKKTLRVIRFNKSRKDKKKVTAAIRRVKTMAGALLRDVTRKLSESTLAARHEEFERYRRVINQERRHKNKSRHEPEVSCICKGKERKKYEFGSKAAIVMTKTGGVIARSFSGNPRRYRCFEAGGECEFRYNNKNQNLMKIMAKMS